MVLKREKWKFNRRSLLASAGAAALGLASALVVPRMVHSAPTAPRPTKHPAWDSVVRHTGTGSLEWMHKVVHEPFTPQLGLALLGPMCSGKTTFHKALSMLLPEGATSASVDYFADTEDLERLRYAWLLVQDDHIPKVRPFHWYRPTLKRDDRFLKFVACAVNEKVAKPRHMRVAHLNRIWQPDMALFKRLEDEKEAFTQTLLNYTA